MVTVLSVGGSIVAPNNPDVEFLNRHMNENELHVYINKLSSYMESSGKTYKNHKATILKWYNEDKEKKKSTHKKRGNKHQIQGNLSKMSNDEIEFTIKKQNINSNINSIKNEIKEKQDGLNGLNNLLKSCTDGIARDILENNKKIILSEIKTLEEEISKENENLEFYRSKYKQ